MNRLQKMARAMLTLALAATCAAQAYYSPTNSTPSASTSFGIWEVNPNQKLSDVAPLSSAAFEKNPPSGLTGDLFHVTADTVANVSDKNVAFISCDPDDYPNSEQLNKNFDSVLSRNATAILLYSKYSQYCENRDSPKSADSTPLFAMGNQTAVAAALQRISEDPGPSIVYLVTVRSQNSPDGSNNQQGQGSGSPLGPSPSTAVAMIILYSITGVITALFLIIIISGAIRAHRHPERYGPRNILGRPRQSRAKGLARAMLDTIPIVKFGQSEEASKNDIEIRPAPEQQSRTAEPSAAEARTANSQAEKQPVNAEDDRTSQKVTVDEAGSSTADVNPVAAAAATAQKDHLTSDAGLGCSICTDDFEFGQDIRVLPCNHKFHPACVDPWLLNVSGTCPLCRIDLRPARNSSDRSGAEGPSEYRRNSNVDPLAPPLDDDAYAPASGRRRTLILDLFNPYVQSTAEERIAALRRLRERTRYERPVSGIASTPTSPTFPTSPNFVTAFGGMPFAGTADADQVDARGRKRVTLRLQEAFSIRTRRNEHAPDTSVEAAGPSSSTLADAPATRTEDRMETSAAIRDEQTSSANEAVGPSNAATAQPSNGGVEGGTNSDTIHVTSAENMANTDRKV